MFYRFFSILVLASFSWTGNADDAAQKPESVEWRLAGYSVVGILHATPERYSRAILEKGSEHKTVRVGERLGRNLHIKGMRQDKVLVEQNGRLIGLLMSPSSVASKSTTNAVADSSEHEHDQPSEQQPRRYLQSESRYSPARARMARERRNISAERDPVHEARAAESEPVDLNEIRDPAKFRGLIDK